MKAELRSDELCVYYCIVCHHHVLLCDDHVILCAVKFT